jgi:hypothetical protein
LIAAINERLSLRCLDAVMRSIYRADEIRLEYLT